MAPGFKHRSSEQLRQEAERGEKVCKKCSVLRPLAEFYTQPHCRDGLQSWCKACYALYRRERYKKNREYELARNKVWDILNPDVRRALNVVKAHNRRRVKLSAFGTSTAEQIAARREMWGGKCWMCGCENAREMDHVIPLSKGGSNWPANLRPACRSCNASKRDKWEGVITCQ